MLPANRIDQNVERRPRFSWFAFQFVFLRREPPCGVVRRCPSVRDQGMQVSLHTVCSKNDGQVGKVPLVSCQKLPSRNHQLWRLWPPVSKSCRVKQKSGAVRRACIQKSQPLMLEKNQEDQRVWNPCCSRNEGCLTVHIVSNVGYHAAVGLPSIDQLNRCPSFCSFWTRTCTRAAHLTAV
jgi:hypothetical protein